MSPSPAEAKLPRYRPRPASNSLKEILEDSLEELLRVYEERYRAIYGPLHPRVRELFERYLPCGDPHFGFLRLRCLNPDCPKKAERLVPFSCKTRGLCPSCGQARAIAWAERMVEEVLPDVPYVQLVFTIPKILRKGYLFDRSLYGDLCRAAYASTKKFFQAHFPTLEKPVPAMVVAPQSFGSLANFHPHCHALSSLGVFTRDGLFHPVPQDLDFSPLLDLFREELFRILLKKEKITPERIALLRSWEHSGFHLNSERRVAQGDRAALEAVLRYMERPPVALSRLEYLDDGRVLYRGHYHPSLGRDHQLVSALEFLAMLVPHVALRFECRIYSYGALSTTIRRQLGWVDRKQGSTTSGPGDPPTAKDEDSEFVRLRRKHWAKLIAKTYLEDPSLCPSCGHPMRIIAALTSPHQDAIIERILRSLGRWDPPWLRSRKPRGPPPPQPTEPQEAQGKMSREEEEYFNQVSPAFDWDI
jgi:hypothetical protein